MNLSNKYGLIMYIIEGKQVFFYFLIYLTVEIPFLFVCVFEIEKECQRSIVMADQLFFVVHKRETASSTTKQKNRKSFSFVFL